MNRQQADADLYTYSSLNINPVRLPVVFIDYPMTDADEEDDIKINLKRKFDDAEEEVDEEFEDEEFEEEEFDEEEFDEEEFDVEFDDVEFDDAEFDDAESDDMEE